jgi:hypothetical protein
LAETTFAVRATDPAFLDTLGRYLGRFRTTDRRYKDGLYSADSGKERILPGGRVIQGKRTLYWETLRIYAGRNDEEMAARIISFARDRATQLTNEYVGVRAGAITIGDRGILLPTSPEPHMAALVALMLRPGVDYLGDEQVNLDPILHRVHGLGLPLLVDAEDAPRFSGSLVPSRSRPVRRRELAPDVRGATTRQPLLPADRGAKWGEPTPLSWIIIPQFSPGSETKIEPHGGAEALFRLAQAILNLHVWEDRALVLIRKLLDSVPISRLIVGSLPDAAELVAATAPSVIGEGVSS